MKKHTSSHQYTRRDFLAAGAAAGVALGCGKSFFIGKASAKTKGRVIILGFDGMEPSLVAPMLDAGELPNLAALKQSGSYHTLGTTIPPQSPTAWSSFATSKNPGGHGIFDFIRRNPQSRSGPIPLVGTGKFEHPGLAPDGALARPPEALSFRKGKAFWSVADEQGARGRILNVPYAFPPDDMKNGSMLCGLWVPDLRGNNSTYVALSDAFTDETEDSSGGIRVKLAFDASGVAEVNVPGPRDTRFPFRDPKAFTTVPMKLRIDRAGHQGEAVVDGKTVALAQGQWSPWIELPFAMSEQYAVHGIARFFPMEIGDVVRIYMSCAQYDPRQPYVPISSPSAYSKELAERYGLYKTIGWAYDTKALSSGDLIEEAFLADLRETMNWWSKLTMDELERGELDFLVSAGTATDRVAHMFWRFLDDKNPMYTPEGAQKYARAIQEIYKMADAFVGSVRAKLREEDLFLVMSDHGFGSWRTQFNVNGWLKENGYLATADPALAKEKGFLLDMDWTQTKAYAVGLSSMYLNLQGRESRGLVAAAEQDALLAEIRDKLLQVKDPATGSPVLSHVYTKADYKGEAMADAPDFSLGFSPYYQMNKSCALGYVGGALFSPNDDKWSGEHAASDMASCPGVLFANRPIENDAPTILDFGSTVLKHLGRDIPSDYEGKSLV